MEFVRGMEHEPFGEKEQQSVNSALIWVGLSLHQTQINKTLMAQAHLNEFLLDVSK